MGALTPPGHGRFHLVVAVSCGDGNGEEEPNSGLILAVYVTR